MLATCKYKKLRRNSANVSLKCFVIPVIIGDTGIVTKGLKKISGNNTRKAFSRFSTKTAVLRISHIIRKVLQSET
jgi:hypothetical protein